MHKSNMRFWENCSILYPCYFNDPSLVLECGSRNINGSIRKVFNCKHYIGIDWKPGPLVDLVAFAHGVKFDYQFDAVVSASMLEHDPYWIESLINMSNLLKDSGILILTWGAALNPAHCLAEAPDGQFHALKAGSVIELLTKLNIYVHIFKYEANLGYPKDLAKTGSNGLGEVCLVAFKDRKLAVGQQDIDLLLNEDINV